MRRIFSLFLIFSLLSSQAAWSAPKPPPRGDEEETPITSTTAGTTSTTGAAASNVQRDPMIEVSIDTLEITEKDDKQLGVKWGNALDALSTLRFTETPPGPGSISSILKVGDFTRQALAATLNFMIENNQARILANPSLLTKPGFEASFLVGGEIPYPTVGQGGAQGVEYKKYGVALKILPQITPRGTIEAQINSGISSIDAANGVALSGSGPRVPALASREASSKVELRDGETLILAGIKQSRREKSVSRVPILGYIPLLGILFSYRSETLVQSSVVLFVTFRLIKG